MKGLDLDRLAAYLGSSELRATMFAGGRSNLTYAVTDGESRFVLRRPPLGHVLPTAHDMAREFRVLDALSGVGFPVPRPIRLCTDPAVIGAPFYLMEHVDGQIYRDISGVADVRKLIFTLVDTLAAGLDERGRARPETRRQVLDQVRALAEAVRGARDGGGEDGGR